MIPKLKVVGQRVHHIEHFRIKDFVKTGGQGDSEAAVTEVQQPEGVVGQLGAGLSVSTKLFWTILHLRRKWGTIQAVKSRDGTLLTSTEDIIQLWKEHFEKLLNWLEDDGRPESP